MPKHFLVVAALLSAQAVFAQNSGPRAFVDFNVLPSSPAQAVNDPAQAGFSIRVQEITVMNTSSSAFENARLIWSVRPAGAKCEIGTMTFNRGVLDPRSFRSFVGNGAAPIQALGTIRSDSTRPAVVAVRSAAGVQCQLEAALHGTARGAQFAAAPRGWHLDR